MLIVEYNTFRENHQYWWFSIDDVERLGDACMAKQLKRYARPKKVGNQRSGVQEPKSGEEAMPSNMPRLPEMKKIRNPNNTYSLANQKHKMCPVWWYQLFSKDTSRSNSYTKGKNKVQSMGPTVHGICQDGVWDVEDSVILRNSETLSEESSSTCIWKSTAS